MFAPLPFGIPLPVSPDNLFKLSKRNWLAGVVSVPEGLLSYYGEPILDGVAKTLLAELQSINPTIVLEKTLVPRHYKFMLDGETIADTPIYHVAFATISDFAPISVWDFCDYFDAHPELWEHQEMLEFLELLRDNAAHDVFTKLCKIYSFPKFSIR